MRKYLDASTIVIIWGRSSAILPSSADFYELECLIIIYSLLIVTDEMIALDRDSSGLLIAGQRQQAPSSHGGLVP